MKQNIGEVISQNRQNQQMTQEEFASRLGVTPQAVSKWERGIGIPDITLVEGICTVLNINANMLLGIKDSHVIENGNAVMEQEIKNNMFAEPLLIEFGSNLIPCFAEGLKTDFVNQKRKELVKQTGALLPVLRIRDNIELAENEVQISSYDKVLWKQNIQVDENLYEAIIRQTVEVCRTHYDTILNKQLVKIMVDNVKELYPGVADGLVPERISYLQLQKHLQNIWREKGNIRDMLHILEELEEKLTY